MDAITYKYRAVSSNGIILKGELSAKNEMEALAILREQGRTPVEVKPKDITSGNVEIFKKKVKMTDLAVFCRQMSTMLGAGLALDRTLSVQIEQTENKTLKEILIQVDSRVRQGTSFSAALSEHPDIFPKLLVSMVYAGEMTGSLDDVLNKMAIQLERDNRINNKIRSAMIYPVILLCVTVVVLIIMLTKVVPTFTEIYKTADMELPKLTLIIVDISIAVIDYWYFLLASVIGIGYGVRMFLSTKTGRMKFDTLKLRIPKLKIPMQQIVTARFTQTLSTQLSSGISLIEAVASASETCNNVFVVKKVGEGVDGLKQGSTLAVELRKTELFPQMMLSMIGVGEETGDLDGMLAKTAEYFDEMFSTAVQRVLVILEPVMIVIIAVIVGMVVVGMYLPMFGMYSAIG